MKFLLIGLLWLICVYWGRVESGATFTFEGGEKINQLDCKCNNGKVDGQFCGGSKFLKDGNKKCPIGKGFLFYCTKDHVYPQDINLCNTGYECNPNDSAPGKDHCVAGPRGEKDCGCKDNNQEGTFCGGENSKYLVNKAGAGCRDDNIYTCTKGEEFAKFNKRCKKFEEECGNQTPGKATCVVPDPDVDECACDNEKDGWYCGADKKNLKSKKGLGCRFNYRFKCGAFAGENGFYPEEFKKCKKNEKCSYDESAPGEAKCVPK